VSSPHNRRHAATQEATILIVEVEREQHLLHAAAIIAATARLWPIMMTSFGFIVIITQQILATGAGTNARTSIGISVSTGMLVAICLTVVFVSCFSVVMQRSEERPTHRTSTTPPKLA
jgi:HAE1 family hydrophobic/amphiphilic exporter-1